MNLLVRSGNFSKSSSVSALGMFMAIGLFTVSFLASESPPSESPFESVAWSLTVSLIIAIGFAAVRLIVRQISEGFSDLILPVYITFGFYGYMQGVFNDFLPDELVFSDKVFPLLLVALTLLVYFAINRLTNGNMRMFRYVLFVLLLLTFWNFILWGQGQVSGRYHSNSFEAERMGSEVVLERPIQLFPVYWLLFDGYARDDVLDRYFGFDNSPFLEELENRGFTVNREAVTSFVTTNTSVPALMELENLGSADSAVVRSITANRVLGDWRFEESTLARLFANIGYRIFELSSKRSTSIFTRPFAISFYESTGLQLVPVRFQPWRQQPSIGLIKNLELTTEHSTEQDVFVFSYNFQPHPPYLYSSAGATIGSVLLEPNARTRQNEWEDKEGYVGQLQFVNARLLDSVDRILESSPVPPLIIILSDHGPMSNGSEGVFSAPAREALFYERIPILSAVRLPEPCPRTERHESNNSQNIFRMVLNSCFGTDLPLEPNDVYWGSIDFWSDSGSFIHYPRGVWSVDDVAD